MLCVIVKLVSVFLIQPSPGPFGVLHSHLLGWSQEKNKANKKASPWPRFLQMLPHRCGVLCWLCLWRPSEGPWKGTDLSLKSAPHHTPAGWTEIKSNIFGLDILILEVWRSQGEMQVWKITRRGDLKVISCSNVWRLCESFLFLLPYSYRN